MKSSWALPGRSADLGPLGGLRQLGPLHHARHALVDDAVSLQQRHQHLPGAGHGRPQPRDDSRGRASSTSTAARRCRSVHRQYMGEPRGRWEGNTLVVVTTNYKPGPSGTNIGVVGLAAGNRFPVSDQMKTTERLHAAERRHDALRDQDRGSGDHHAPVDRALPAARTTRATSGGNTPATKATARFATTSARRAPSARRAVAAAQVTHG